MSDLRDDELYPSDEAQVSAAAGTNATASLQAGHPFSLLLAEDDRQRTVELEALMDNIADTSTRFARATNPLRARLTLERLLIQVIHGGPEATQGDASTLIRRIAERRADETRVILVIEQAETLHPEVLHFFGQTAPLFPDGVPRLQLLFVGRPEFRLMLDDPEGLLDEQTAHLEAYRPREPEPMMFAPPPQLVGEQLPPSRLPFLDTSVRAQIRAIWRQGLMTQLGIIGGTLVGMSAVTFAGFLAFTGNDGPTQVDTGSALLEMPEPSETEPDPAVLQPGPPKDEATAALRSDFESYLTASGRELKNMTPGQKRAVLQEFMLWRARTQSRPAP